MLPTTAVPATISAIRVPTADYPERDTNYHLHFEYRPNNVARDPRPLLVPHPNCNLG